MANFQELTIGSVITFTTRDTRERYKGVFCELKSNGRVGVTNISAWTKDEKCELSPKGIWYFSERNIEVVKVTEAANIANSDQDEGSSSKSTQGTMDSLPLDPPSK